MGSYTALSVKSRLPNRYHTHPEMYLAKKKIAHKMILIIFNAALALAGRVLVLGRRAEGRKKKKKKTLK